MTFQGSGYGSVGAHALMSESLGLIPRLQELGGGPKMLISQC